jgi:hypothetical protein
MAIAPTTLITVSTMTTGGGGGRRPACNHCNGGGMC